MYGNQTRQIDDIEKNNNELVKFLVEKQMSFYNFSNK
jgi:hypothetical protein